MSNLSDFLQNPIAGLNRSSDSLAWQRQAPIFQVEALGVGAGAELYPEAILKTNKQLNGAGGIIRWRAQNSIGSYVDHATVRATIIDNTSNAGVSKIVHTFMAGAGAQARTIEMRGDLSSLGVPAALVPGTTGTVSLGHSSLRWLGLYVRDNTGALGQIAGDGSGAIQIGTSSASSLNIITNGVNRGGPDASGRWGFGASGDTNSQAAVTTISFSSSQPSAFSAFASFPSSATTFAYGYYAFLSTTAAAFTCPIVGGFVVDAVTKGAGSTITKVSGLVVVDQTVGTSNLGVDLRLSAGSNKWNVNASGTAQNYFAGSVGIGISVPTTPLHVSSAITSGAMLLVESTGGTYTDAASGLIKIKPSVQNENQMAIAVWDTSVGQNFKVSALGSVSLLNAAATLAVSGGRMTLEQNAVFDLDTATSAVSLYLRHGVGTYTLATGKTLDSMRVDVTVDVQGTAVYHGINVATNDVSTSASSTAVGVRTKVFHAGPGTTYGAELRGSATAGHTGTVVGVVVGVDAQAGSAVSRGIHVDHSNLAGEGIVIGSFSAGNSLSYGIRILSNTLLGTYALSYEQRSTATAGFLRYRDSSAVDRFIVDSAGDLTFGGSARRIKGDTANATLANRLMFTSSSTNTNAKVSVIPSGNATTSGFDCFNGSDPDNAGAIQSVITNAQAVLQTMKTGSGTVLPLDLRADATNQVSIRINTNMDVQLGNNAGLITSSTAGFPFMPSVAGTPTGAPTSRSGFVAFLYDTTAHKIWVNDAGTWKQTAALT